MEEVKVDNLLKFYSLLLLFESPRHGYNLIKTVEKKMGRKVSASQIYPFLAKLQEKGYIKIKSEGKREKKIYSLTSKGKTFCKSMLQRFADLIELAIEPTLSRCMHCGCEIYRGGYKERIKGKQMTFCCSHCAASFKNCSKRF
jgi:DNA-binding PadR family transcriptional regulator